MILGTTDNKFGNYIYSYSDTKGYYYGLFSPQGNSYTMPKKGALSFWIWTYDNSRAHFEACLGAFDVFLGPNKQIFIDGNVIASDNPYYEAGTWLHIYIIWDDEKKLLDNMSVKVFINDNLILQTNVDIINWNYYPRFCFRWYCFTDGYTGHRLDNVKLWNHVVTEDLSFEYNNGNGREYALHVIYSQSNNFKPGNIQVGYFYK